VQFVFESMFALHFPQFWFVSVFYHTHSTAIFCCIANVNSWFFIQVDLVLAVAFYFDWRGICNELNILRMGYCAIWYADCE
jgi:hypothetical protein